MNFLVPNVFKNLLISPFNKIKQSFQKCIPESLFHSIQKEEVLDKRGPRSRLQLTTSMWIILFAFIFWPFFLGNRRVRPKAETVCGGTSSRVALPITQHFVAAPCCWLCLRIRARLLLGVSLFRSIQLAVFCLLLRGNSCRILLHLVLTCLHVPQPHSSGTHLLWFIWLLLHVT